MINVFPFAGFLTIPAPFYKSDFSLSALPKRSSQILYYRLQLDIPHIYKDGYEADDIIGTVSHHFAQNEDTRVYILSSDKDMRQLITNNIVVVRPEKNNDFIEMDVQYIQGYYFGTPITAVEFEAKYLEVG